MTSPRIDNIEIRSRGNIDTRSGDHTDQAALYSNFPVFGDYVDDLPAEHIASRLKQLIQANRVKSDCSPDQ